MEPVAILEQLMYGDVVTELLIFPGMMFSFSVTSPGIRVGSHESVDPEHGRRLVGKLPTVAGYINRLPLDSEARVTTF